MPEQEEREWRTILEEIMAHNFPKLMTDIILQIQKAPKIPKSYPWTYHIQTAQNQKYRENYK